MDGIMVHTGKSILRAAIYTAIYQMTGKCIEYDTRTSIRDAIINTNNAYKQTHYKQSHFSRKHLMTNHSSKYI